MKEDKYLIKKIIKKIKLITMSTDISRFQLAKDLLWAKQIVLWKMTEFKGWTGFCKTHIKIRLTAINRYTSFMFSVNEFKYSDKQVQKMFNALGWSRTVYGMLDMNNKLSVTKFITCYKDVGPVVIRGSDKGDRAYTFSLPAKQADVFDTHLENYGMTHHDTGRRGIREAMIKLVNRKLK